MLKTDLRSSVRSTSSLNLSLQPSFHILDEKFLKQFQSRVIERVEASHQHPQTSILFWQTLWFPVKEQNAFSYLPKLLLWNFIAQLLCRKLLSRHMEQRNKWSNWDIYIHEIGNTRTEESIIIMIKNEILKIIFFILKSSLKLKLI